MLIHLLVGLIVAAVLYWAILQVLHAFGIGEPIRTVVLVVFVVLLVFWLLSAFGLVTGDLHRLR